MTLEYQATVIMDSDNVVDMPLTNSADRFFHLATIVYEDAKK
jgi:hypothetical protein